MVGSSRRTWALAVLLCASSIPATAAPANIRVVELMGTLKSGDRTAAKGDVLDGAAPVTLAEGGTALLALPQGLIRLTGPASFTADRDSLTLASGSALSVLRKLKRAWTFKTPSLVAAVRGTVFYAEAGAKATHLCLCEGSLLLNSPGGTKRRAQRLTTTKHESYSFSPADGRLSRAAEPMRGHDDAEIAALKKRL